MFKSFGSLFEKKSTIVFSDDDIKYVVQDFFQHTLKTDQVLCVGVHAGIIDVRVGSPALHQEVLLLQYDLDKHLQEKANFTLKGIRIVKG